ncbi:uncharacterized protein LOC106664198 [Cimex lectularius]|uniref:RPA-interacting protein C-terminal domain-containing protein n=1 Tax=Cimex lectularius TaxID=79782 RepID=A0A8I6RHA0_CIMLE|nr:uncharacterized protein LOC106664198 [Cimex lectularius]
MSLANAEDPDTRRKAMYKQRSESPRFRDLLRERCHRRIKASRVALLEQFRNINNTVEVHSALSSIIHQEASVLREEIYVEEMETEEDKSITTPQNEVYLQEILREYENVLEEEETMFSKDWDEQVICPLCEKCVLKQRADGSVVCVKCSSHYPRVPTLHHLRNLLNSSLEAHERNCKDLSQFALINDRYTNGLFLICQTCQFFFQTL